MKAALTRCASLTLASLLTTVGAASAEQASREVLTLGAAISEALHRSPALVSSEEAVATADIHQALAASRFRPKLSPVVNTGTAPGGTSQHVLGVSMSQLLVTGATVQSSANVTQYGSGPSAFRDAGFSIGVSQPLLRGFGGVARAELDRATRATEIAAFGAADSRGQLVIRVAEAYFAVVQAQRLELETRQALDRATKLAEMSEARVSVGLATRLDVYRAGLLKAQAQAAALRERDGLASAREDLNALMGRPAEVPVVADDNVTALIALLPRPDGQDSRATPPTLDVIQSRARLADAESAAATARWHQLPGVTLDVSYTRQGLGAGELANPFRGLNGWRVGLSTTHVFDASAGAATAALASMHVRGAERQVADAEERAAVGALRAWRGVSRASETVAVQQTALTLAEQQRELAAMRYERGLADNLELIDAESRLFQAHSALIAAEIDLALALLREQRAAGTLHPERVIP